MEKPLISPAEAVEVAARLMGYRLDLPDGSPGVVAAIAFLRDYQAERRRRGLR